MGNNQMMVGEPTVLQFRCSQCGVDCTGAGRLVSHLRYAHGIDQQDTPGYVAVTPKQDVTPREMSALDRLFAPHRAPSPDRFELPTHDFDGIASPFAEGRHVLTPEQEKLPTRYQQLRAKGHTVDEADAITRDEQEKSPDDCVPPHPSHHYNANRDMDATDVKMDGGAVLSVDPKTGAAKGVKLARFDLVPMDALTELANHYGIGERKYPSDEDGTPNWSKGMAWSKVTQAAMRHLALFIGGEDIDEETGQKHVIAVAWHMFALAHYANTKTGTDDRWQS